jgi:hypothetical protein
MAPGIDLAGQIIVEGSRQDATSDSHPFVVLEPFDGAEFFGNNSFVIHEVVEGDYELRLYNLSPGEYVKSIRFGVTDVLTNGLHCDGRSTGRIEVVLGTNPAFLSGVAVNEKRERSRRSPSPADRPLQKRLDGRGRPISISRRSTRRLFAFCVGRR